MDTGIESGSCLCFISLLISILITINYFSFRNTSNANFRRCIYMTGNTETQASIYLMLIGQLFLQ